MTDDTLIETLRLMAETETDYELKKVLLLAVQRLEELTLLATAIRIYQ